MTVEQILATYKTKKYLLAKLAQVEASDVSRYLRDRSCSARAAVRIEKAASDLASCYARLELMGKGTGVYLSLRENDIESVKNFIEWIRKNPEPEQQA